MSTSKIELSPKLEQGIKQLVSDGWFNSKNEIVEDAIRRFLESHSSEIMEQFAKEDIEWGLHGDE